MEVNLRLNAGNMIKKAEGSKKNVQNVHKKVADRPGGLIVWETDE